jgi:hypothetical protein
VGCTGRGCGGAEAAAQHAQIGVVAAWAGPGGAALELKDRRLGAVLSGWRGRRRWHRSSSVGGSSNQRVEVGLGTARGGHEGARKVLRGELALGEAGQRRRADYNFLRLSTDFELFWGDVKSNLEQLL